MIGGRLWPALALVAALVVPSGAFADSLVDMLLRVAGLTVAPGQLRGPGEVEAGSIWIANLDRHTVAPVVPEGGYRSPVFSPADGTLVALRGDTVVRLRAEGGTPAVVQRAIGVVKLVGFDGRSSDDIVVLLEDSRSPLGVLSLKTGTVVPLPYAGSPDQKEMLAQIRGEERLYGATRLYVKTESKRGLSRVIEWTDVYVRRGDSTPRNVSGCDAVNCGQPALSPDGRLVAFVKAGG